MPVGLFGKYPQKRDFVSLGIPRSVLEPFETWLQSAVAASRNHLGRGWQDLYLVAPLWRFWIGPEIFGAACTGVLMPSVDGIGRFFPLAILAHGSAEDGRLPPSVRPNEAWYRGVEDRLLQALGDEANPDPNGIVADIASPHAEPGDARLGGEAVLRGRFWTGEADSDAPTLLEATRDDDYIGAMASRSLWWTRGGNGSGAAVYGCAGLPDPYFYVRMIGGTI